MVRRILKHRHGMMLLAVAISLFGVGQALAWQYNQQYATGLYGSTGGKQWSPILWYNSEGRAFPRLQGDGGIDSQGYRATQPVAYNVRWNQQAIDWMRANSGDIAVTFHSSFDGYTGWNGGCDNYWLAANWASTSMPGASYRIVWRNCYGRTANEIRIYGDKNRITQGTSYFAQGWYQETSSSSNPKGQFNVDTYWVNWLGGSENYHQKYCIPTNSNTANTCPVN